MGETFGSGFRQGMNDIRNSPDGFATSFDAASARLRAAMAGACAGSQPGPARVVAAIAAAIDFAAADATAARVLGRPRQGAPRASRAEP